MNGVGWTREQNGLERPVPAGRGISNGVETMNGTTLNGRTGR